MEFDLSKENIQPLRGGRNVTQLEVALLAQSDSELQRELLQQKEVFEEAIRSYEGEDPLDNWYNYISWVEQSYPKHGHEGNLIVLLKDCLAKFEHDEKYMHDRRLCKLWIKFIDLQQNPIELFQLLHSKGICVSCADLYRAWAYYHETVGDYKRADAVFRLGLQALAQPYEELAYAHQNMYTAIGKQALEGVDERRLEEQRNALTSLRTYKHKQRAVAPNVRVGNQVLNTVPGRVQQQNASKSDRSNNVPITLYEDTETAGPSIGAVGGQISVLDIARKQETVHKENTLKPGTWKKSIIAKTVSQHLQPSFSVHEDSNEQIGGIRLPPNFASTNIDDFTNWDTPLFIEVDQEPKFIPMYPKHLVYAEPNVEYSLEEIRARKWFDKNQVMEETLVQNANMTRNNANQCTPSEIEQAIQSILPSSSQEESPVLPPTCEVLPSTCEVLPPTSEVLPPNNEVLPPTEEVLQHFTSTGNSLIERQTLLASNTEHCQSFNLPRVSVYQDTSGGQFVNKVLSQEHYTPSASCSSSHQANAYSNHSLKTSNSSRFVANVSTAHQHSIPVYQDPEVNRSDRPSMHMYQHQEQNMFMNYQKQQNFPIYQDSEPNKSVLRPSIQIYQDQEQNMSMNYQRQSVYQNPEPNMSMNFQRQQHVPVYQNPVPNKSVLPPSVQIYKDQEQNMSVNYQREPVFQEPVFQEPEPNKSVLRPSLQVYQDQERNMSLNYQRQPVYPEPNKSVLRQSVQIYQNPEQQNISMNYAKQVPNNFVQNFDQETHTMENEFWQDTMSLSQLPKMEIQKPKFSKFQIHEDSQIYKSDSAQENFAPQKSISTPAFSIACDSPSTSSAKTYISTNKKPFSIHEDIPETENKRSLTDMPNNNITPFSLSKKPFSIHEDIPEMENKRSLTDMPNNNITPFSLSKKLFSIHEDNPETENKLSLTDMPNNNRTPFSNQAVSRKSYISSGFNQPETAENYPKKSIVFKNFIQPSQIKFQAKTASQDFTLNESVCNTQVFNFNLNTQKSSTPCTSAKKSTQFEDGDNIRHSKKVLFGDDAKETVESSPETFTPEKKLSTILETTREYQSSSSSSSSGTTLKTTPFFNRESMKVIPEVSVIQDETALTHAENKNPKEITNNEFETKKKGRESINEYGLLRSLLNDDEPAVAKSNTNCIDLTDEDTFSISQNNLLRLSKANGQMTNYESPMKNQFKEMSCDSNDSLTSSPVKGLKMDVDVNVLSHNSNSDFKMDHESFQEPPTVFDSTILKKCASDPLAPMTKSFLLEKVGFPSVQYSKDLVKMNSLPKLISKKEVVNFRLDSYLVEKVIGKGAFGQVYKAINMNTSHIVALKLQKPPNMWEFYIIKEIRERLINPHMLRAFMDVTTCYVSTIASVLVSEFFKLGSLLDLTNKVKKLTGKGLKELVAIYYATEILTIVHTLHQCKIIHADIKPDNFLVTQMPPEFGRTSLQLIDFGCSIDMSLYPEGTTFRKTVTTENFICTEMKDGRPWTYQTDIFCLAATIHVLLFDKYMQIKKQGNVWAITQHIARYMRTDLWKTFFFQMLNIDSCNTLPDLSKIKNQFECILSSENEALQDELRLMSNLVLGR